jgi:uncharacterized protein
MTPAHPARRAVALSTFDLPDAQQLLLHGCEDCACPVSDDLSLQNPGVELPPMAPADTSRWACGRDVVEIQIDSEHKLLFNPVGRGGVVVLNQPAYRI